jgi:hypothetical protein
MKEALYALSIHRPNALAGPSLNRGFAGGYVSLRSARRVQPPWLMLLLGPWWQRCEWGGKPQRRRWT